MGVRICFHLFLLLIMTVVTGPVCVRERKLNLSEDLIQVHPQTGKKTELAKLQAKNTQCNNPVVLNSSQKTNNENTPHSNSTFLFLCELQKFLNEVLPQKNPLLHGAATIVSPSVLHSLPPLTLGESSSESLLLELVNSSGLTVFSFPRESLGLRTHKVMLDLNPLMLSVLKIRLDEALAQVQMEEAGQGVMDNLKILSVLSALPENGDGCETDLENSHEVQYRALLLLKALQAVLSAWAVERAQRAARADQENPSKPFQCHLQSFTVSLDKFFLEPSTVNINNCEGACGFPLTNGNNHAILLNSHIQNGQPSNRALCCVPVAYDDLCVIELHDDSTVISYKTNMVAKECGCR
ncbi:muellerian-inhibiting factor [Trichomycterus rosablanca]|uniref:muellerian-inhibiting factor n=1 Tax=Trichomycterus rosablanca TaxID=2290929 RepID=UPI002F35C3B2